MGSVDPLFSAVFDLSLLKVSTLNQVKHSLFMCIKLCFPWALSVPRPRLDTPSLWCPHLFLLLTLTPAWGSRPNTKAGGEVASADAASSGAVALGTGWQAFSGDCSMWAFTPSGRHMFLGSDCPVIFLGIPMVWPDSVGAPSQARGAWFVLWAIREKSVHAWMKGHTFLLRLLRC